MSAIPLPLPPNFAWSWDGPTVSVTLPPLEETNRHVYEPVLTRADAQALADAVAAHGAEASASAEAPRRLILVHDPRYAPESIEKFRLKLVAALEAKGLSLQVNDLPGGAADAGVATLSADLVLDAPAVPEIAPSGTSEPAFPPEPDLVAPRPPAAPPAAPPAKPPGTKPFDAGGDTDMGVEPPEQPAKPGEPGSTGEDPTKKPADRPPLRGPRPGGASSSWRRRFEKRK